MVAVGSKLFIHGGLAGDRFFNDMYTIDTGKFCAEIWWWIAFVDIVMHTKFNKKMIKENNMHCRTLLLGKHESKLPLWSMHWQHLLWWTAAVNMMWEKINMKGDIPDGRAAHSAVSHEKYIFIFGGLDATGALNTMYKYHIGKSLQYPQHKSLNGHISLKINPRS